jgi:FKBP-type peptidyl-prolyl cis-trans isomerase SlyD
MEKNMSENKESKTVQAGQVVTMGYTLMVDGKVVDSSDSKGGKPVRFIQGERQIVVGLEKALYGMAVGESKEVVVAPAEGYGEFDPKAFQELKRSEFPPNIPLNPGVNLRLRDKKGAVTEATVVSVEDDKVRLNFNHTLAGKELHFSIKIMDLRPATPEELAHKHVHD